MTPIPQDFGNFYVCVGVCMCVTVGQCGCEQDISRTVIARDFKFGMQGTCRQGTQHTELLLKLGVIVRQQIPKNGSKNWRFWDKFKLIKQTHNLFHSLQFLN
uniref:Uncharacterized protein n=1 Tax=Cacopsylla melanoneura TaxID=428564 RepID=A0A8D8YIV3_9HEMI